MRYLLTTAVVGALLALAIHVATPRHHVSPLALSVQSGAVVAVCDPDNEDAWIGSAQRLADARREAIAVTQDGRLVALINPR